MTPQIESMLISAAVGAAFGVVLATSRGSVAMLFSGVALGIGGELLVGQDFATVLAEARRLHGPLLLGAYYIHLRAWSDAFAEARRHSAAEAAQQHRQDFIDQIIDASALRTARKWDRSVACGRAGGRRRRRPVRGAARPGRWWP